MPSHQLVEKQVPHDRSLKVAVLGTGSIGTRHYRILADRTDVQVAAVPTRRGRGSELRQHGINAFDDFDEALTWGVNAVIVATDTGRHVQDVMNALTSSCDVLVEKPIAEDSAAGARLLSAARSLGARLNVASCLRFDTGLRWSRDQLWQLGTLERIQIECLSWLPGWRPTRDYRTSYSTRSTEGGVLRDLIHEIDYALWMFGPMNLTEAAISNSGRLGLPRDLEEAAILHAHVGDERTPISIRLDFASAIEARSLRVEGTNGELVWNYGEGSAQLLGTEGERRATIHWDTAQMYNEQLDAWIRVLKGVPSSDLATGQDGVAALTVCDHARSLSSRAGTLP